MPQGNALALHARFAQARPAIAHARSRCAARMPKGASSRARDGVHFSTVIELPGPSAQARPYVTFATGRTSAELIWRIRFDGTRPAPLPITEAVSISAAACIVPRKRPATACWRLRADSDDRTPAAAATQSAQVIDLSAQHVAATAPRLAPVARDDGPCCASAGRSPAGVRCPRPPRASGSKWTSSMRHAVRAFAERVLRPLRAGDRRRGPADIALTDSWEAGQQNWTPAMFEGICQRAADTTCDPWLPVLTGRDRRRRRAQRALSGRLPAHDCRSARRQSLRRARRCRAPARHDDVLGSRRNGSSYGRRRHPGQGTGRRTRWANTGSIPKDASPTQNHVADVREAASAAHLYGRPHRRGRSADARGEDPVGDGSGATAAHRRSLFRRRHQSRHAAHLGASAVHRSQCPA